MKAPFKYTLPLLATLMAFLLVPASTHAQSKNGITFTVERLKKPADLIEECDGKRVMKDIAPQLWVHSQVPDHMVEMGAHPFFNGMYKAYAEHRPFELSPDMIWLLICQGFARHVNNNSEELRNMFVNFEGKKSLVVKTEKPLNSLATWEEIIPEFMDKAAENTGKELFANLTPNFSTTTQIERTAVQITALESVKSYFEFIVIYISCGIPEITLRGTPADWKLVLEKTKTLRKYKLDWWIDELEPQLQGFINASEGKIDKDFWRNMFKYHTEKKYGLPRIIDGWIVKFFPYNNEKHRNNLKTIRSADDLPDERVAVDFKLLTMLADGSMETRPMQFIAGFTGLKQNHKTMCLAPQISWMVSPKDTVFHHTNQFEEDSKSDFGLWIRVSEVPQELLTLDYIMMLKIDFLDSVKIPASLCLVDIDKLYIDGKISEKEIEKIVTLFPRTALWINQENYHADQDEYLQGDSLSTLFQKLKPDTFFRKISLISSGKFIFPDQLQTPIIDRLEIQEKQSKEDEEKLSALFPNSEIYVNGYVLHSGGYLKKIELIRQKLAEWENNSNNK